jgi:oxaloacetate decarboxylase gamma subunit
MLYGMGTVFVFLTILVFATALMSRIVLSISKTDSASNSDEVASVSLGRDEPSPQILAAIKQAIAEHRGKS